MSTTRRIPSFTGSCEPNAILTQHSSTVRDTQGRRFRGPCAWLSLSRMKFSLSPLISSEQVMRSGRSRDAPSSSSQSVSGPYTPSGSLAISLRSSDSQMSIQRLQQAWTLSTPCLRNRALNFCTP